LTQGRWLIKLLPSYLAAALLATKDEKKRAASGGHGMDKAAIGDVVLPEKQ
jgi:hypothetical protein